MFLSTLWNVISCLNSSFHEVRITREQSNTVYLGSFNPQTYILICLHFLIHVFNSQWQHYLPSTKDVDKENSL